MLNNTKKLIGFGKRSLWHCIFGLGGLLAGTVAHADECSDRLQSYAMSRGISANTFKVAMDGFVPNMKVTELQNYQPEFKTPIWDYMSALVDDERVRDGRQQMQRHANALAQAELNYGVPKHVIAAVWGVESDYGKKMGKLPLVQSLATLACYGRRANYFRDEWVATLKIIQNGDIAPEKLIGSWAGAFGQTQFMPGTYLRLAVDMDGDGRRDVVDSVADAVGSTANFLDRAGWINGQPWGYEVKLPPGFDASLAGRKAKRSLAFWQEQGISRINGADLTGNGNAGLLLPAGVNGPAFLVFKNFDALYSYNAAETYGLAIGLLADRLAGADGIRTPWPTDDPGTSREERREIQRLLIKRGFNIGEVDGAIGEMSRQAIMTLQSQWGMPVDGRAGKKFLLMLRQKSQ